MTNLVEHISAEDIVQELYKILDLLEEGERTSGMEKIIDLLARLD